MVAIHTPVLEWIPSPDGDRPVRVKVTYVLFQSALERRIDGLNYREQISLWRPDGAIDRLLCRFAVTTFPNTGAVHVQRMRTFALQDTAVDALAGEPAAGAAYARVSVRPFLPDSASVRSNEVRYSA